MPVLAAYFIFLAGVLATPQNSSDLRSLYGEPEFERFVVRPGVGLTVERGADGLVCKMSIKPRESPFVVPSRPLPPEETLAMLRPKLMSREMVNEILDEVVGLGTRGAWADVTFLPGQCPSAPQKLAELRSRYGNPDADNFLVRPGIRLAVEYGSDGLACEMKIEQGATTLLFKTAEEILDEAIPPSGRGRLVNGGETRGGWGMIEWREYENVRIGLSGTVCPPLLPNDCREQVQSAGATFKRAACQNVPQ